MSKVAGPTLNLKHGRNYWVISDTHFFHENSIKWPGRNHFKSVSEADELILTRWNATVKPGDYVYHLGDVMLGNHPNRTKIIPWLNGTKRLIVGNHDDLGYMADSGWFKKVLYWRKFSEFRLILTHAPLHSFCIAEGWKNVHGHIHNETVPDSRYFNACVERNNFTPVNLETINGVYA